MDIEKALKLVGRILIYVGIYAALGSASAFVTFFIMSRQITVQVPELRGVGMEEARNSLDRIGLTLKVGEEDYDLNIPAGQILEQDLAPGTLIKGKGTVEVILSKGPEVRLIPSAIGMTLKEAERVLGEKGLEIKNVVKVHSDRIREGEVIAQKPVPDEWTGEPITLVASAGPYGVSYYCPSFKGMVKEDALLVASELGLNAVFNERGTAEVVVHQKPDPGEELTRGDTIQLDLGSGRWIYE